MNSYKRSMHPPRAFAHKPKRAVRHQAFPILLVASFVLSALASGLILFARPPGRVEQPEPAATDTPVSMLRAGRLPGVTWADDIEPIFARNGCGDCHAKDSVRSGLPVLVDPGSPDKAVQSFNSLVYPEGWSLGLEGKGHSGQSRWPTGLPTRERRIVWLGHPERSTLMRKLDRDYYDWTSPPRYLEEGLRLRWGAPMPLFAGESRLSERGAIQLVAFQAALWAGLGHDGLHPLRPQVPARDRELIRHWIANTTQLTQAAEVKVQVFDFQGDPVPGASVFLVGDSAGPERPVMADRVEAVADAQGRAQIRFSPGTVVSTRWYVSAETKDMAGGFQPFQLTPGATQDFKVVVFTRTSEELEPEEDLDN